MRDKHARDLQMNKVDAMKSRVSCWLRGDVLWSDLCIVVNVRISVLRCLLEVLYKTSRLCEATSRRILHVRIRCCGMW